MRFIVKAVSPTPPGHNWVVWDTKRDVAWQYAYTRSEAERAARYANENVR